MLEAKNLPAEMHDSAAEIEARWPELGPLLGDCQLIAEQFDVWDHEARGLKQSHSWIVVVAAIFGTVAVLLAIWQLSLTNAGPEFRFWFAKLEFGIALVTLISVLGGLYSKLDHRWIRARLRAEQCRLLKFAFLRRAGFWLTQPTELRREFLRQCLNQLAEISDHDIKRYVRHDLELKFEGVDSDQDPNLTPGQARELSEYWQSKRIEPQRHFFEKGAHRRRRPGLVTKYLLPNIFFLSLACVVVHFGIDWFLHANVSHGDEHGEASPGVMWPEAFAWVALFLAAGLPVLALGIRAVRSAFEFDRNENRFHAAANQLDKLAHRLKQPAVSSERFSAVSNEVETLLRNEHQSWVHLMIEAEWF